MTFQHRARLLSLILLPALVGGCLSSATDTAPPPPPAASSEGARRPVIIDTDLDHSDLAAIAIMLRDPGLDVRAITIAGTGLVHCAGGRRVTRYLLEELREEQIPFACGREDGGPDARPFPDDWRAVADNAYGLEIPARPQSGLPPDAVTILAAAVTDSPSAPTIVALGPWTNLEDAFVADPSLADRVAGIHAMLGTLEAPGNVLVDGRTADDLLEWNAFADPSAVSAVFATDVPIDLVPLDATDDVPVPPDLTERLATDHAAAGADLMYELLLRNPARLRADEGQQLWDELAALALTDPGLVTWRSGDLSVGEGGRLVQDGAGRATRVAVTAHTPAVETAMLAALRRGIPRATPFALAGSIEVIFDGTRCQEVGDASGTARTAGLHVLRYTGQHGTPSGTTIVGVRAPRGWDDLVAWLATADPASEQQQPDWIVIGPSVGDEAGDGAPVTSTGAITAGTYGPVCLTGTWPEITFVPGTPFQVAD